MIDKVPYIILYYIIFIRTLKPSSHSMVLPRGFEPLTSPFVAVCSIPVEAMGVLNGCGRENRTPPKGYEPNMLPLQYPATIYFVEANIQLQYIRAY